MTAGDLLFQAPLFQVPNLVLAALMYTLLGRYVLSLFFPPDSDKVIWRAFRGLTDWVVRLVGRITPKLIPVNLLVLFAAVWLLMLRVALFLGFGLLGLLPKVTG
ncbi:MAG: YggT family protein [Hyphomicrobiaceae bacterium]